MQQSIQSSLKNFTIEGQEPYLDSIVLHSPLETLEDTFTVWKVFESYHPHTIRNIGISNTTPEIVAALVQEMKIKPAVVQNRFFYKERFAVPIRKFCRDNGILFQSFWTLSANPNLVNSQPVLDVAQKAGVDIAAAYYSLVIGLEGVTILDGTTDEEHMKEDLAGLEKAGVWAEGQGAADWEAALQSFKSFINEP